MGGMAVQRPNVLLICVDQWRRDCLSIDGHPVVRTPFLDQLASRGARFSQAYSATPTCIPARAAMFTGLGQERHGRVGYQDGVPWSYSTTLAGEFSRNGYQTQAVGKMHVYPERNPLGFENVILHDGYLHYARRNADRIEDVDDYVPWLGQRLGYKADYFDHGVNCNSHVARPWDKPEDTHPTNFVASKTVEFLKNRDKSRPFFLFSSFHRPHPPYDPPAWAFEMYLSKTMPKVAQGDWYHTVEHLAEPHSPERFVGPADPETLQRARAGYYGHMTHIDHQINRIMEALDEVGIADNTYVCFTSDHGEMMGDHHMWRKGYPYEGSAGIPLILFGPNHSGISAGSRSDQLVELRDILPTLLDCAGLPIPESIDGKSLLPLAAGGRGALRPYLHGEHYIFDQSIQWIVRGQKKYIWWSGDGTEQFFDLANDPYESRDLIDEESRAGEIAELRAHLAYELAGREEGASDGKRLIPGRSFGPVLAKPKP